MPPLWVGRIPTSYLNTLLVWYTVSIVLVWNLGSGVLLLFKRRLEETGLKINKATCLAYVPHSKLYFICSGSTTLEFFSSADVDLMQEFGAGYGLRL